MSIIHKNKNIKSIYTSLKESVSPRLGATTWIAIFLLIVAFYSRWTQIRTNDRAIDYFGYWQGSRMIAADKSADLYSLDDILARSKAELAVKPPVTSKLQLGAAERSMRAYEGRLLDSGHSPFLFFSSRLFSRLDYERSYRLFGFTSLALIVFSLVLLAIQLRYSLGHAILLTVVILLCFTPLNSEITVGNINQIQLSLLIAFTALLALKSAKLDFISGFGFGLVCALKPNIVLGIAFVCLAVMTQHGFRRFLRLFAGICIAFALSITIAGIWHLGFDCWTRWIAFLPRLLSGHYTSAVGNYGFVQLGREMFHIDLKLAALIFWGAIYLAVLYRHRCTLKGLDCSLKDANCALWYFFNLGYGLGVTFFLSGLVWIHYYIFLLPLAFCVGQPQTKLKFSFPWPVLVCVCLIPFSPLGFVFISYSPQNEMILSVAGAVFTCAIAAIRIMIEESPPKIAR